MTLDTYDSVTLYSVLKQLQQKPLKQRTPEYIRLLDNLHLQIVDVVDNEKSLHF